MAHPVKTMVAKGGLQPPCNHEPRNYRNHRATTLQPSAIKPQPTQKADSNRATASLRSGTLVAPRPLAPARPVGRFGTNAGVHRGVQTFSRSTL